MRARLFIRVAYDAPALECRRVLRILPLPHCSLQSEALTISPTPSFREERPDHFGNRVLHLRHARIELEFALALDINATASSLPALTVERATVAQWKLPSRAVVFSPEFLDIARTVRPLPPQERAVKLNELVHNSLEYTPETSSKPLRAPAIWTQKHGTCADFAHVLIALARMSGLPARYVAGFGPAPGALHAWVELGINGQWEAFDPTHKTRADGLYLPVAIGRDFYDCSPHHGSFRGGNAALEMHCELK